MIIIPVLKQKDVNVLFLFINFDKQKWRMRNGENYDIRKWTNKRIKKCGGIEEMEKNLRNGKTERNGTFVGKWE